MTVGEIFQKFPVFTFQYVVGFILGFMSEVTLLSLLLGSIALAVLTNVWTGIAVFFLVHVALRMTNSLGSAIVTNGNVQARASVVAAQRRREAKDDTPEDQA